MTDKEPTDHDNRVATFVAVGVIVTVAFIAIAVIVGSRPSTRIVYMDRPYPVDPCAPQTTMSISSVTLHIDGGPAISRATGCLSDDELKAVKEMRERAKQ